MTAHAIAYLGALIAFAGIDAVWLSTMAARFYRPILGDILLPEVNPRAAIAFYLLYPVGLTIFAVAPALKSGDVKTAALLGALFGLFAYGTYDLTNQATLRNWTTTLTLADMAWGTLASAIAASVAAWIGGRFV